MGVCTRRKVTIYPGILNDKLEKTVFELEMSSNCTLHDVILSLCLDPGAVGFLVMDGCVVNIDQAPITILGNSRDLDIFPFMEGG